MNHLTKFDNYKEYVSNIQNLMDERIWIEAKKKHTKKSYSEYLVDFPVGIHKDEAHKRIYDLEKSQNETRSWEKAKKINTVDSYQRYLTEFPNGEFVDIADELIQTISLTNFDEERISAKSFKVTPPTEIGTIVAYHSTHESSIFKKIRKVNRKFYEEFIEGDIIEKVIGFIIFLGMYTFTLYSSNESIIFMTFQYLFIGMIFVFLVLFIMIYTLIFLSFENYFIGTKGFTIIKVFKFLKWSEGNITRKYLFQNVDSIEDKDYQFIYHKVSDQYSSSEYDDLKCHRKVREYFEKFKRLGIIE